MPHLNLPWISHRITADNKQELHEVSHVTHIEAALRILKDQNIYTDIITETDILKEDRIMACWFAPNFWYHGSRYGQVSFVFPADILLKSKRLYWVEKQAYMTTACRFLVTQNNYDDHIQLKRYRPKTDNGPLRLINGKYHWNKDISLQLIVDDVISIDLASRIDLIKHHPEFCCLPTECTNEEKTLSEFKVSQLILSYLLSNNCKITPSLFTINTTANKITKAKPINCLSQGVHYILRLAHNTQTYQTPINFTDVSQVEAIVKASLVHLSNNDTKSFRKVISVLGNAETFEASFLNLVKDRFGLTSVKEFVE